MRFVPFSLGRKMAPHFGQNMIGGELMGYLYSFSLVFINGLLAEMEKMIVSALPFNHNAQRLQRFHKQNLQPAQKRNPD